MGTTTSTTLLIGLALMGLLAACEDSEPFRCEAGALRCSGSVLERCDGAKWAPQEDCLESGRQCVSEHGEARCLGRTPDGVDEPDAGAVRDAAAAALPDLPDPEETLYEPCPSGQAYHPLDEECITCPFSACDGRGEDGLFEGTTLDGKCVCKTADGFYWPESGLTAVACDKDGDGWVSVEARSSIESKDRAYKDNARCDLRIVDRFVLESEGSDGAGHVVALEEDLPLYEIEALDDQNRLELNDKIKPYGGIKPSAHALNSLTKACVDTIADYNGNDVADLEEWDTYDEPVQLWSLFEELSTYTRFAYFSELHTGWFEGDEGTPNRGSYHVRERSRLNSGNPLGVPVHYFETIEADDVRWYEHAEHWRRCDRQTDAAFTSDMPARGMDFARYNQGLWNLGSRGGTGNALSAPGAEAEGAAESWMVEDGPLEVLTAGQCGAPQARSGGALFALGGACGNGSAFTTARQTIDVPEELRGLATLQVAYGGYLRNAAGRDRPSLRLHFLGEDSEEPLASSDLLSSAEARWVQVSGTESVPGQATRVVVELTAQRQAAHGRTEAFFDDLYLRFLSAEPNLVINGGGESPLSDSSDGGWIGDAGADVLEVAQKRTGDPAPVCGVHDEARSGARFFVVGRCLTGDATGSARAYQEIDLGAYAQDIASGNVAAWFGGWLRTGPVAEPASGDSAHDERAEIYLEFLGGGDGPVDRERSQSLAVEGVQRQWRRVTGQTMLPRGTRAVRFVLARSGDDDRPAEAAFDDLFLRLSTGARMFHHSQFKCVELVDDNPEPGEHPQRVTSGQLETDYHLNSCRWAGEAPPTAALPSGADGRNPWSGLIECSDPCSVVRRDGDSPSTCELAQGTVGLASVRYLHYPRASRRSYERGCVNECLAVDPQCSMGEPGSFACKVDREYFGTTYCDCLGGFSPWPACDACDAFGNWDETQGCAVCKPHWDVLEDCAMCLGNRDPDNQCETCRNSWIMGDIPGLEGQTDDCETCPDDDDNGHWTGDDCDRCVGNWDEAAGCLACDGNWDEDTGCEQCLPNFDPTSGCEDCLGNWDPSTEPKCSVCLPNFDEATDCVTCKDHYQLDVIGEFPDGRPMQACAVCQTQWDIETGCTQCRSGWSEETLCTACKEGFELFQPEDRDPDDGWIPPPVCVRSNLLSNGGAEEIDDSDEEDGSDPTDWMTYPQGTISALFDGHCEGNLPVPVEGLRYFNLGAVCDDNAASPECDSTSVCRFRLFGICFSASRVSHCDSTTAPLWYGVQAISLEDIYDITSDPEEDVFLRFAGHVYAVPGPNPNPGLPSAVFTVTGYRPNGEDKTTPTSEQGLGSLTSQWQLVMSEPIRVEQYTHSLQFLMGAYLTPGGSDQVYFDSLQLRLCFGEEDCCIKDEVTGEFNCCNQLPGGQWDCGDANLSDPDFEPPTEDGP
ncbi:MAG: hypothetical protein OXT09_19450 [Myxococcales bacterium]|nr:hypothetical protein [Myxococcales bacterium]